MTLWKPNDRGVFIVLLDISIHTISNRLLQQEQTVIHILKQYLTNHLADVMLKFVKPAEVQ